MSILFWLLAVAIIYIYVGYPVITYIFGAFKKERRFDPPEDERAPSLAFIISAFNEESVIEEKIKNTFQLDYPKDKLKVYVISDASDDATDEIVKAYPEVQLKRMPQRRGKTFGINEVVPQLTQDIVVFSDANAIYKHNALKELAKYFQDPETGYVVGNAQYYTHDQNQAGEQENTYWTFEVKLKEYESRLGSVVGGDGAIYAIRRSLFQPLQEDDINDFVNPLHIILQGYRGIFNPQAVCFEHTAESFNKELKRKRRIVNRSWRGLMKNAAVLNPFKTGLHAWQVLSHKMLRWLGGLLLILFFAVNAYMAVSGILFFKALLIAQLFFYALAASGLIWARRDKKMPALISLAYYFVGVHIASLQGIWDNYAGKKYVTWQTIREKN